MEHGGETLTLFAVMLAIAFFVQIAQRGRRWIPLLIGFLVLAAFGGYTAHMHREEARKSRVAAARLAEFKSRISCFAAKSNAITDWQESLSTKSQPGEKPYTAELAPLLVRADARPILVFASLLNVSENGGRTLIYFDDAGRIEPRFKLQLDCKPTLVSISRDDAHYRFAVIAQIISLDYVLAGDYSLATGRCVDIMPLSLTDYYEFVIEPELAKQATARELR